MRRALVAIAAALVLAGCSAGGHEGHEGHAGHDDRPAAAPEAEPAAQNEHAEHTAHTGHTGHAGAGELQPLRAGERRRTLRMPAPYTPSPPTGVGTDDYRCFLLQVPGEQEAAVVVGTDDYRCFLLDPHLQQDAWLTGTNVLPGNPDVVHHVILFRVPPEDVAGAEAKDAETPDDQGWTCFGGTGLAGEFGNLDDAPWLGAWAPGGDEVVTRDGYGTELPAGSRVIMQVHYNLLAGAAPDVSATQIRTMPRSRDLTALHTYLAPSPVELPCRPGHTSGALCGRDAAVADAQARFGAGPGATANALHVLCPDVPIATDTSTCDREVRRPLTVLGAAGHMHLLGRTLRIEANPDTPQARTLLDLPVWDFDDQGSRPIDPVHLEPGDTVRITCTHDQALRDLLPAFEQQREDKYVVWAEGTTDEMCLGMLSVAFG